MVVLFVSEEDLAKIAGSRLRDFSFKKGYGSAQKLYDALIAAGFSVSLGGLRKHWYGNVAPTTATAADYCAFLGMSMDYYILGREPQKLTKDDLLAVLGTMIEDAGGTIPGDDPDIVRAAQLLMKIKDGEKKKAVVRMLEAFIGDTA